ncbi:MAG: sigma-70 family RNA polymerase sigma factor [Acidobacteriota bacterium]
MRAEAELVERYGRGVAIILERHTSGRPEAEDLYQDTFRLVLEKLRRGELREPAKLPGFLSRVARNLAIEFYRKAARRKTEPDSDAVSETVAAGASPLGRLVDHEHAALVRQAIGELRNDRDRQILLRFYIAEEDKERISADYDLTALQFNRVLHRARQRYKALFQERHGTVALWTATLLWGAILGLLVPLSRWRGG